METSRTREFGRSGERERIGSSTDENKLLCRDHDDLSVTGSTAGAAGGFAVGECAALLANAAVELE